MTIERGMIVVLALALLSTPAPQVLSATVPARFLIVPGKSVGPLEIGMTRQRAQDAMTNIFSVRARRESISEGLCWFSGNLCAGFLVGKETLVTATVKRDRRFMTQEGVRVGSNGSRAIDLLTMNLGKPGIIRASDGNFVGWRGLTMTVGYANNGMPVVTSIMISPKQ